MKGRGEGGGETTVQYPQAHGSACGPRAPNCQTTSSIEGHVKFTATGPAEHRDRLVDWMGS